MKKVGKITPSMLFIFCEREDPIQKGGDESEPNTFGDLSSKEI